MKFLLCAVAALVFAIGPMAPADATIYHGAPHLRLTIAVVEAGGGASHFDSRRLVRNLAGAKAAAEEAKLTRQYGTARVEAFYNVFTFAVNSATKTAHNMLIPLPKMGEPDPANRRAVATALYRAGITSSGRFDVGYMLEMLMSHQIHHTIMGKMDAKFTPAVNADFHLILTTLMHDLKTEYAIGAA